MYKNLIIHKETDLSSCSYAPIENRVFYYNSTSTQLHGYQTNSVSIIKFFFPKNCILINGARCQRVWSPKAHLCI